MKEFDITERMEASLEDCNEHYRGMLEIYENVLEKLKHDIDKNIGILLSVYLETDEESGPRQVGHKDAVKLLDRMREEMEGGYMDRSGAITFLEEKIKHLSLLVR